MLRIILFYFTSLFITNNTQAQLLSLSASYDRINSKAIFYWNMIDHPSATTYVLERSLDRKQWTIAVTDDHFQRYSRDDIFDFDEKVSTNRIYYYRLSIIDKQHNVIRLSKIISIETKPTSETWKIVQNPVMNDLILSNKGDASLGTINIQIIDVSGKVVIKFRAASIHNIISIPLTKLRKGYYVVQLSILNKTLLNQKFLKQ